MQSEARVDPEGKPVLRDGLPVQRVSLLVRPAGERPEVIDINVAQIEPIHYPDNARVRPVGLTCSQWSIEGRSGTSYSAERIEPAEGNGK